MKNSRTTLPLGDKDREAIAVIREYYGLHSDSICIRMAIRELERAIKKQENIRNSNTLEEL